MNQVHKETLTTVENALPNRANLDVEIFGMEGIPEDIVVTHNQRVIGQLHQAEAERRAATGNAGPGGAASTKKPKFESPADIKKRLAEHKAKMAEQAAGGSSGGGTPVGAGQGAHSPALAQSALSYPQSGSPSYGQPQPAYGAPPGAANAATYGAFPQTYEQPNYQAPPQNNQIFAPPGGHPFPSAGQQFPSSHHYQYPGQGYPPQHQGIPSPYGAASPPPTFPPHQPYPQRIDTPPQPGGLPQRPGSLPPAAPGLPQRPAFQSPPINAFQMQQMHLGQAPGQPSQSAVPASGVAQIPNGSAVNPGLHTSTAAQMAAPPGLATSVDDLVSGAAQAADQAHANTAEAKATDDAAEKKGKKDKDKTTKLVYSDNAISPEEKMAKLPRYAFVPDRKEETVLGDATTAAVAGVVQGEDDVLDVPS
ncbi:MAG: hypothetical protein M1817_002230 [Caeruleum heppii]|nr:MAG: hypothetical protein M1817_002230 [Caeruleum heppii]